MTIGISVSLETPEKTLPPRFRFEAPDRFHRDTKLVQVKDSKPARLRWQCPWHGDPEAQSIDENTHPDYRAVRERRAKVEARLNGFHARSVDRRESYEPGGLGTLPADWRAGERYEPDAFVPHGWRCPAPEQTAARYSDFSRSHQSEASAAPDRRRPAPELFAPDAPTPTRTERSVVVHHEGVDMVLDPSVPIRVECVSGRRVATADRPERPWDISVSMLPLTLASLPRNRRKIAPTLRPAIRFLAMTTLPRTRYGRILPPSRDPNALTLVLDLDETLVHCDKTFGLPRRNVHVRPYARDFLRACCDVHEVVVFTASTQGYADSVLDQLDPDRTLVHHRLYRDSCSVNEHGGYFKDLQLLGRNLDRVVLVDNSLTSLALQPDNGIPCRTWTEDPLDRELLDLLPLIRELDRTSRVQPTLRARYRLGEFFDVLKGPLAAPLLCELSDLD